MECLNIEGFQKKNIYLSAEFDPQALLFLAMTESQQPEIVKTSVSFNMDVLNVERRVLGIKVARSLMRLPSAKL